MSGGLTVSQGLERGLAAHAAGHLQDAAKLYEAILKVRPDYIPAWNGLGVIHLQTRQTAEGLRCFDEACRIHRAPHLVHNIAVALERLGREDEALAAYGAAGVKRIVALRGDLPSGYGS
ncbi:MAG: tetratricopeptide repeat protein, partial [Rhodospirillales bacterium]|nr:tetratricopeptide repeat protein [Rhodospirillales bacterium]